MGLLSKGSKPVVGLNIGTKYLKAVEVRNSRGQLEVLGAGVRPTPAGVISNGIIMDPGMLGAEIKELLSESGIKCKRVVSSLAGQQSLVVRIIEVPRMTAAELKETMKWEIERHIPFPAEDVVMDFKPLEHQKSGSDGGEAETMEVLLAVAQEEMINAHIETIQAAGLLPQALDIEPLACARVLATLEENGSDEDSAVALINLGARVTDISVVRGWDLTFTRSVPLGGDNLTLAISEALGVQPEEAERAKIELGSALLTETVGAGVDTMTAMAAAAGDEESPFASFEFDADEGETTSETATETETTGEVPAFDLSLDSTDEGATESDTGGALPAFDLSLDAVEPADSAADVGGLDFSLDSDTLESPDDSPAVAEAEETTDEFDLSLDLDDDKTVAKLSLDSRTDQGPEDELPPLRLDLDSTEEDSSEDESQGIQLDLDPTPAASGGATEEDTPLAAGGFQLDFGDGPSPTEVIDQGAPGTFELNLGSAAAAEAEPVGFELDLGGPATPADADTDAGLFDLSPATESDPDESDLGFSFDLAEPSDADEAVGDVSAGVPADALSTEEEAAPGGLMDLDDLAGLAELGTAGGDVTAESVYAALSPVINELITETRRSLEYYASRYPGANIDRVLLMGGTARLRGLADVLSAELGLPVAVANPFDSVRLSPKSDLTPEYLAEMSPALCTGLGLAIRDMVED